MSKVQGLNKGGTISIVMAYKCITLLDSLGEKGLSEVTVRRTVIFIKLVIQQRTSGSFTGGYA